MRKKLSLCLYMMLVEVVAGMGTAPELATREYFEQQGGIPANGVLTEAMASAMSPLLDGKTTLKDALAMLIDAEVQVGIVVDGRGAVQGLVTADEITAYGRRDPGGAEATAR